MFSTLASNEIGGVVVCNCNKIMYIDLNCRRSNKKFEKFIFALDDIECKHGFN